MSLTSKVLVTGGAGFIGSNLADELIRQGAKVTILDSLITGFRENLEEIEGDFDFVDSLSVHRMGHRKLVPAATVKAGRIYGTASIPVVHSI